MLVSIGFSLALILSLLSMSLFLSFGQKCDIVILGVCNLLLIIQVIHLRVSQRRNFNFWNMFELLRFLRTLGNRLCALCFTRWLLEWRVDYYDLNMKRPPEANVLSLFERWWKVSEVMPTWGIINSGRESLKVKPGLPSFTFSVSYVS